MATVNSALTQTESQANSQTPIPRLDLSEREAASLLLDVRGARAILRTVILAIRAQEDHSIVFDDKAGTERWSPAVGEALERLGAVRSVLVNAKNGHFVDWVKPINLVEAVDAALWHGYTCPPDDGLKPQELLTALKMSIGAIDELLRQCEMVCGVTHG
ncbi:MAG: hypothetical protein KAY82_05105 [Hylemonella sp.]|nr:hypothetical protein [Hylemonella sp.]